MIVVVVLVVLVVRVVVDELVSSVVLGLGLTDLVNGLVSLVELHRVFEKGVKVENLNEKNPDSELRFPTENLSCEFFPFRFFTFSPFSKPGVDSFVVVSTCPHS